MFQSVESCLKLQLQNHATFDLVYANSFNLVGLLSKIVRQENSSTEPYSVFQQDQTNCIDLKRRLNKGVRAAEEVR